MHIIQLAGLLLGAFWLGAFISPLCSKSEAPERQNIPQVATTVPVNATLPTSDSIPIRTEKPLSSQKPKVSSSSTEKLFQSNAPSICVIARSSPAHLPTALSAFSFSLLSTNYPNILQFIIACEFSNNDEQLLRDTVASINQLANESPRVFVVNRTEGARESLLFPKLKDFCYIDTDLTVSNVVNCVHQKPKALIFTLFL